MISNPLLLFLPCSFVPVAVGLAITRNRLWDIDLIINRSLVVIIAATLLAILFLIVVLVIQAVFHSTLYGLPFVGAAVLSGALFDPTRRRVQHVLDRRFYRWRFDLIQLANAERDKTTARVGRWTGKILDGYQIEGVIGSGGMGEVYRATKDNRTYAIKTVLEDAPADGMDRLRREIVAIKPMQHPNIVQFYEAGLSPAPYIVLEFIDGVNLRALLQSRGRLSPEDALVILRGLADGLDYAHDRGVIHRDLKPSNIVLRMAHEGNTIVPLLIDFGLARVSSGSTVTGTGAIGTISYMAPEQIESGKTITRQTDVYSLGVILYEMLTGQLPFGGFPAQIMFAHLQQPPPDPRLIVPELPETFALAIQKAMAKEKAERWQSAGEMIAALAGEREAAVIG
jgi:serine/threonine protein kinase